MKFGSFTLAESVGVVLAHSTRAGTAMLKKGHVVTEADIATLRAAGVREIIGARLEPGDIAEDAAAARIAQRLAGAQLTVSAARMGRCNLVAAQDGVALINSGAINAANLVSEAVTIATLPDKQAARARQIVATVKIIPFAVSAAVMTRIEYAAGLGAVALAPYAHRKFALISTLAANLKPSVVASTEQITRSRITALGGTLINSTQTDHTAPDVAREVRSVLAQGAEIILIIGASATVDRGDVVPAGIVAADGVIDHFGMPVDPGNLLVLAHIGSVPVLVLPGCARSPKLNGVDWIMQGLAAGVSITPADIMGMGVGGLLVDTPSRPLPGDSAVKAEADRHRSVAGIVLAAGQSRRMGPDNKLLRAIDGIPLVRRTVLALRAARVTEIVVVTGHMQEQVRDALAGLDVTFVHNPHYADGLSTSLKAGLCAISPDMDATLVGLGDMPAVTTNHFNRLIAGFDPENGRAIGVPVHNGKRGNPVLWARRFFADMQSVSGDTGAKALIGANESLVYEMEFGDTGVLIDLDTPEQWSDYLTRSDN